MYLVVFNQYDYLFQTDCILKFCSYSFGFLNLTNTYSFEKSVISIKKAKNPRNINTIFWDSATLFHYAGKQIISDTDRVLRQAIFLYLTVQQLLGINISYVFVKQALKNNDKKTHTTPLLLTLIYMSVSLNNVSDIANMHPININLMQILIICIHN